MPRCSPRPRRTPLLCVALMIGLHAANTPAAAQDDMNDVQIETVRVADGVYMLTGRGGNIGLSVGPDGAFLVDDQYAPLTDKIQAAVTAVTDAPLRFVINTHWHGDHTGGNENLGEAGALIVAHENVRKRMSMDQFMEAFDRTVPASAPGAWPVITFSDAVTFHWNGDAIHIFHVSPAHTDGDAVVHFSESNVVHMGDTYFNGFYPFIDVSSGGAIDGLIEAADRVLALADDDTRIIPGHGPLSNKAELETYRAMLVSVRNRVRTLIREGKTVDEVVAARPSSAFDEAWGGGFMQPDQWIRLVYTSMQP